MFLEYVLSKMRFLVDNDGVVCMALGEVENKLREYIRQIEQTLVDAENKPLDLSGQYSTLRDYSL
jgi:hypothetical protein